MGLKSIETLMREAILPTGSRVVLGALYFPWAKMHNNRRHWDKVSAALQFCPCCGR